MAIEWRIGDKIYGRWEVRKLLGGGMGKVYVVYDHEWQTVLAAKTFHDELFAHHPRIMDYFTREAHVWVHLDLHPQVTRAHFVKKIEGKPYVFLEHVSGGTLRDWINTPRLLEDLPQVLRFALQFCDGMNHVLAKGIKAHRDIKPANCLVTQEETLKVTDFGLAKAFDTPLPQGQIPSIRGLSRLSMAGGTYEYMAPERFDNPHAANVRADIYSFGIMLFEMLTGRVPFTGQTWQEFAQMHQKYALPALRALVKTCLAKDPQERFADFGQVREALAKIYQRLTRSLAPVPAQGGEPDAVSWTHKGTSLAELGRHQEALKCYEQALELEGDSAAAWTHKGASLAALGYPEEALESYQCALKQDPHYAPAWTHKGASLAALGHHEQALKCYEQALKQDPHYAPAWTHRGVSLAALGRPEEALKFHGRALELNPWYAAAWTHRGRALSALGRHDKALWCHSQALERDVWYVPAWYDKGVALAELGRHQEALACYERALELDQGCVPAWTHRGVSLAALQQYRQALQCYECALALDDRCAPAWYHQGIALEALQQYQEALQCYERALALDNRCALAWYHKGLVLEALQQPRKALACYNRTLRVDLDYAPAWYSKGQILTQILRNHREARACFERASRLGFRPAAQMLAQLRK